MRKAFFAVIFVTILSIALLSWGHFGFAKLIQGGSGGVSPAIFVTVDNTDITVDQTVHIKVVAKTYSAEKWTKIEVDFGDGQKASVGCSSSECEGDWDHTYKKVGQFEVHACGIPESGIAHGICNVPYSSTVNVSPRSTSPSSNRTTLNPLLATSIGSVLDRIGNIIFFLASSLAVLMLMIGGFIILTAAGSPDRLAKGRRVILLTLLGFAIMMLSKGIIDLIYHLIGVKKK